MRLLHLVPVMKTQEQGKVDAGIVRPGSNDQVSNNHDGYNFRIAPKQAKRRY
jgi:hypothetical protein